METEKTDKTDGTVKTDKTEKHCGKGPLIDLHSAVLVTFNGC